MVYSLAPSNWLSRNMLIVFAPKHPTEENTDFSRLSPEILFVYS